MEPRGYGPPRPKRPQYKRYYKKWDYPGRQDDLWVSFVDQLRLRETRARIAAIRAERAAEAARAAAAARRSLSANYDPYYESRQAYKRFRKGG